MSGRERCPESGKRVQSYACQVLTLLKKSWMAALLIAFLSAALAGPSSASAIGFLVSANPGLDQQLINSPHSVTLEFSVPSIPASFSGNVIRVTNPSGKPVEVGSAKTSGMTLSVPLQENLPPDKYQVAFRYVCDDGHVLVSAYNFTVVNPDSAGKAPATNSKPTVKPSSSAKQSATNPNENPQPTVSDSPAVRPSASPTATMSASSEPEVSNSSADPTMKPEVVDSENASEIGSWVGLALFMLAIFAGAVILVRKLKK